MPDKNPMFDLENCEDVELNFNKTTSDNLIKAKKTKNIKATANQAGLSPAKHSKHWYEKPFGIVLITVASGLIVAYLVYCFGW